ncbi:MAG: hypothetical protein VYE73_14230 [Acidobacteriota bacterium]|nr:hypothetical protein [Acidobacteriota bacterium]
MSDPLQRSRAGDATSMRIDEAPVVVFSLETTGFSAGRHRICEI